jgi:hypothetical protein
MSDREVLFAIVKLLSGREWNADTLEAIADVLRRAGFPVLDVDLRADE